MPSRRPAVDRIMAHNNLARVVRLHERRSYLLAGVALTVTLVVIVSLSGNPQQWSLLPLLATVGFCLHLFTGVMARLRRKRSYQAMVSGLSGEQFVCRLLAGIDNGFIVRNQVLLPNPRSRTGHTEVDFVLIGRKALYLVETKNNAGKIRVMEGISRWPVKAVGKMRLSSMRNPIRQVQVQARVLGDHLRDHGFVVPVQPAVGFSNPRAQLFCDHSPRVPVFVYPMQSLVERIRSYEARLEGRRPDIDQQGISRLLDDLHQQALKANEELRQAGKLPSR